MNLGCNIEASLRAAAAPSFLSVSDRLYSEISDEFDEVDIVCDEVCFSTFRLYYEFGMQHTS